MGLCLQHEGRKRKSGRFEWGSGETPYQHEIWFKWGEGYSERWLNQYKKFKAEGKSQKDICRLMGMKDSKGNYSTSVLRNKITIEEARKRAADEARIYHLVEMKGMSVNAAAKKMGIPESTARGLLDENKSKRKREIFNTAQALKEEVKNKGYLDIGPGASAALGVSKVKLNAALQLLSEEGYQKQYYSVKQATTKFNTTIMCLVDSNNPDTPWDFKKMTDMIQPITTIHTFDGGTTYEAVKPPVNIDSKRIKVRYGDKEYKGVTGSDMDGVIQLKPGVEDLNLCGKHYAQVRIAVDGTHYMKGMAIYADPKDFPPGVDVIYNTNKPEGSPFGKVFKEQNLDNPENPFEVSLKKGGQRDYIDKNGETKQSALNIMNEEGDWSRWSKNLPAQMLAKQPLELVSKQLNITKADLQAEFDDIMSVTNPVVKQKLLASFSDDCDTSALELKAAPRPRQQYHNILPSKDVSEKEIYAPNYKDGESVVLIRFPHGGLFEIPELTVNNKTEKVKKLFDNVEDAVVINPKTAAQLSGADFDGDTTLVIPNNDHSIKVGKACKELIDFDTKAAYPAFEGMKTVKDDKAFNKQMKMGEATNLIADMTIKGAELSELVRATKYSMVVIDAEKHNLNWRQCYSDMDIGELCEKYQGKKRGGSSTLITRSKSPVYVEERQPYVTFDKETGEKIYKKTGKTKIKVETLEDGTKTYTQTNEAKLQKSKKMLETADARTLISDGNYPVEQLYADYANFAKALGNKARKAYMDTKTMKYDPSANKAYAEEVESLKTKLRIAESNKPLERKAQLLARREIQAIRAANPNLSEEHMGKMNQRALTQARAQVGARHQVITFTPREWEAIQAGAITHTLAKQIIDFADIDVVREMATPRYSTAMSPSAISRAKAMAANGYTQADIASILGVSASTISRAIKS